MLCENKERSRAAVKYRTEHVVGCWYRADLTSSSVSRVRARDPRSLSGPETDADRHAQHVPTAPGLRGGLPTLREDIAPVTEPAATLVRQNSLV